MLVYVSGEKLSEDYEIGQVGYKGNTMKGIGRHYLTLQGIESIDEAVNVMKLLATELEQLHRDDILGSFMVYVLYDEEIILDSLLVPEEVLTFTEGKLPVVYVNIACRLDQEFDKPLKRLEERFELKMFKSFSIGKRI